MEIAVILLAGGSGSRIHSNIPKQFIEVLGKPLIIHTLEALCNYSSVKYVCVVCNKQYLNYASELVNKYGISKVKKIVPGGKSGLESTYIGFKSLPEDYEVAMVHDANRPIIDSEILIDCENVYKKFGNAVSAVRSVDLTYESTDGISSNHYLNRDCVWKTHTPQLYNRKETLELYDEAFKNGDPGYSSTTELYVKCGKTIFFSASKMNNIKITYPEDFELLTALYLQRGEKCELHSNN